jgi:amino acid adenylation domain-containing protein
VTDLSEQVSALSPEKRALLEQLLAEEGDKLNAFPLSFAQQRLWFVEQLQPDTPRYNIPAAVRMTGSLHVRAMEQSLNEIVRRHEALRTTFATVGERPAQRIIPTLTLPLPVVDLEALTETDREAEVQRRAREEAQRPFDLAQGPLLRAILLHLADDDYVFLLTMHHIISDGWSLGVFMRELAALYAVYASGKPSVLPPLPIQYADFAVWQQEWLRGDVLESQTTYWKERLGGQLPLLELPADRRRPVVQSFCGARHSVELPQALTAALSELGRQQGITLFMTLLAAFKVLLQRSTGETDICVGSPIANRTRRETEALIGFFVNTLVLRTDLSGNPTFRELLTRVRESCVGAYAHQDLPFEKLVEVLHPERDLSRNPLFQVMFALQNAPMPALELADLTLSLLEIDHGVAKFDLTLDLSETPQGISGWLEYNTDLFDATTIARMAAHFRTLLEGIVADPEQRLSDLPLLTEVERHRLLVEWNDTGFEFPQEVCIHQLFEAQAEQTPEAVAVVFGEDRLTYRELNRRANQLAHHLQKLGVGPEVPVGICIERSMELAVGLLAILKAGGAYVPLDPSYPQERLAFMLEDTKAPVLLAPQPWVEGRSALPPELVCLDTTSEAIAREREENPVSHVTAKNLAYIIYTSGSTGRPKGVAIEHHSTVTLLEWARELFPAEQRAGVLASTSICFDLSVFELFVPLCWGGKAILAENALHLPALPAARDVTLVNTVPSALAELLRIGGIPTAVQVVNLAGEPLQNLLAQEIYQHETVQQVFNLYGPSEDTTYSTFALVQRGASTPPAIGRPVANTQIYLLDVQHQPVPVGVPGELYIGGNGLARGYFNRPELSAEKFIPNPFSDKRGARLYATGDLARYLPDGNVEFLGRLDHQVKIRGFRIELGEIEAVLSQHPAVRETVVLARQDIPGDKRLVAYVVLNQARQNGGTETGENGPKELRNFLRGKLPDYMVPAAFVLLDALPLTPNGKVDRRALPRFEAAHGESETPFVAPRNPTEQALAAIWARVLGRERVGIHHNFFDLGGHSLLATEAIAAIRDACRVEVPLRHLFENPTIAGLAEAIEQVQRSDEGPQRPTIVPVPREAHRVKLSELTRRAGTIQIEGNI